MKLPILLFARLFIFFELFTIYTCNMFCLRLFSRTLHMSFHSELEQLSGIAAILRFPMAHLLDDDNEDSGSDSDS